MKELNFKHTWKQICHNRIQLSRNGKEFIGSVIKVFDVFFTQTWLYLNIQRGKFAKNYNCKVNV